MKISIIVFEKDFYRLITQKIMILLSVRQHF